MSPRIWGPWLLVTVLLAATGAVAVEGRATDQHGNVFDLAAPTGTYTVIDFAASWCVPCYRALPRLQALARSNPEIRFLVVSVDDQPSGRDQLVSDLGLTLPVLWDQDHQIVEQFSPSGFPATYLLDPEGNIVLHHDGTDAEDWQRLASELERIQKELQAAGDGSE